MPGSVQEFFETLPSRADTSKIEGMTNSYAFDIEGAGQWTVKVADGAVSVHDGLEDGADCTIAPRRRSSRRSSRASRTRRAPT